MSAIRKILVAVKNPDARSQPGVEKALHIAKTLGASVELFHAISSPVFLELQPLTGQSLAELKRESLALRRQRMQKLIAQARKLGVTASAAVEWDFPPHEAIVRRARHYRADLIIAECHQGRRLTPWLMHLTDWELLRLSPVPVLLLKHRKAWRARPAVLAAVDPSHTHAKPSGLDAQIVGEAERFAQALRGTLHLVHANFPAVFGLALGDPGFDVATLAATYEQQKQVDKREFDAFAEKTSVPRARRHLIDSDPVYGIPNVARKTGASLVVMGAVSRSGLKRVFIGNTAERVLNSLPCDVLVVKPPRFIKRVADKPRGMRVAATAPLMPMSA